MTNEREAHLRFMSRTRPPGLDKDVVEWALAEIEQLRSRMTPEPIMTDVSEPSEAEVEAAARAMYEAKTFPDRNSSFQFALARLEWSELPDVSREQWTVIARAALSAAAQVRAGAEDARSRTNSGDASPYSFARQFESHASAEPDSGPSVLGLPKGEE